MSVNTRWAMDDPLDWDWGENYALPGSVTITGDTTADPGGSTSRHLGRRPRRSGCP